MIYRIYTSTDDNDLIKPENPTKLVRHKHQIKIKIKVKKTKTIIYAKMLRVLKTYAITKLFSIKQHLKRLKTHLATVKVSNKSETGTTIFALCNFSIFCRFFIEN